MAGSGQRYKDEGYEKIKPLIEVDGKPMIEHVVKLFPDKSNFVFVCRDEHLKTTNLKSILKKISPNGKILPVKFEKKGPVHGTFQVLDTLDDNDEVLINYCDFSVDWNYKEFLKMIGKKDVAGVITAYRGFHPHMLGKDNYAFMRNRGKRMIEIREKRPFTKNRMREYASCGTYYFKRGSYVKKYFKELIKRDLNTNGEYYVSEVYNLLVRDGLKVLIYEVENMLQWGTPKDLKEYQAWSNYFLDSHHFKKMGKDTPEPKDRRVYNYWKNFFIKTRLSC